MEKSFFAICEEAAKCSSPACEPLRTMIQQSAAEFFSERLPSENTPSSSPSDAFFSMHYESDMPRDNKSHNRGSNSDRDFGYVVCYDAETGAGAARRDPPGSADGASWLCITSSTGGSPLTLQSPTPPGTYSFLEASFARRLQRRFLRARIRNI